MTEADKKSYEWRRDLLLKQMKKQTDQWLKDDARSGINYEPTDPLPPKKGRKPSTPVKPVVDLTKPRNKFFNFD